MKTFLLKLLSIKWNVLQALKQKEKDDFVSNQAEQFEPLPILDDDQRVDVSITNNPQIHRKIFPLNQSAVQVFHHLSNAQNDHSHHQSSCCRRKAKSIHEDNLIHKQQLLPLMREKNPYTMIDNIQCPEKLENLGKTSHAIREDGQSDQTTTSTVQSSASESKSLPDTKQEFVLLPFDTGPDTKQLYNEMNIRELVNTVRTEIGALIDTDRNNSNEQILSLNTNENLIDHHLSEGMNLTADNQNINLSAVKKKSKKKTLPKSDFETSESITESSNKLIPTEQCNNCCCNFLHYSLRQVMHDSEQMKQFALNTSMIGLDPSKLRDPSNTLCPAICLPMYNCEYIGDQRFPMGPTFTTITKTELNGADDHSKENRINSMVIQTINTHRGQIQIKLDSQSFGLAPFFSDQYESFIKGPPSSIFFTNYINTYQK